MLWRSTSHTEVERPCSVQRRQRQLGDACRRGSSTITVAVCPSFDRRLPTSALTRPAESGCGRDLADAAGSAALSSPQSLTRSGARACRRRAAGSAPRPGHREHHVARAVVRQAQHWRAGLPPPCRLWLDGGDHGRHRPAARHRPSEAVLHAGFGREPARVRFAPAPPLSRSRGAPVRPQLMKPWSRSSFESLEVGRGPVHVSPARRDSAALAASCPSRRSCGSSWPVNLAGS